MTITPFAKQIDHATPQPLPRQGSWPKADHVWDARELDALALAQASGRPLLVRGEPGTGKSQLARAAAALLGWHFRYAVVNARMDAQDLLWQYDAVERLAAANRASSTTTDTALWRFVKPGPLWWALNPSGATQHAIATKQTNEAPEKKDGTVVLIDEVDKADSDFPNSLLEVMANHGFTLPWGEALIGADETPAATLLVITSNEERELPPAFVRRCVCLHLAPPADEKEADFIDWMVERAKHRFSDLNHDAILKPAAAMVLKDRKDTVPGVDARPGLAEYLDLLAALHHIAPEQSEVQEQWLQRLAPYALIKKYPACQKRGLETADPRGAFVAG